MNLKSKNLPKGLITLEGIFNSNYQARRKGSNLTASKDDYTPIAIVDWETHYLEMVCTEVEHDFFIKLCQEFNNVIAWKYEDLKGFFPTLF